MIHEDMLEVVNKYCVSNTNCQKCKIKNLCRKSESGFEERPDDCEKAYKILAGETPEFIPDPEQAKQIKGKIRPMLVPPELVEWVARVREYGTQKYKDPENWRKVPVEEYANAMYRHLLKYQSGEQNDEESGLPHIAHIACNAAFILGLEEKT